MEWLIAIAIFLILAKRGLRDQGKSIEVKAAASQIAANTAIELAELLEVEVKDLKGSKKP